VNAYLKPPVVRDATLPRSSFPQPRACHQLYNRWARRPPPSPRASSSPSATIFTSTGCRRPPTACGPGALHVPPHFAHA
jgi:hypothetical protein